MVKAVYTIAELAKMLGISKERVRRLVRKARIATVRELRTELVPISELKERCPLLWESLVSMVKKA